MTVMPKKKKTKKNMESGTLTGSSCEPHFYIPITLNAANTPLYGSCKLETRSVSSVVVRKTSNTSTYINMRWRYITHRFKACYS